MIKVIKMLIEKGEHLMITFTPKPPDLPVVLARHCPGVPPRGCLCVIWVSHTYSKMLMRV